MKSTTYAIFAILTAFAVSAVTSVAHARHPTYLLADNGRHQKQNYSLDRAGSKLRKKKKGRVLSADTYRKEGLSEHRIRMLSPDGRVRTYRFDSRSSSDID